jgi:RHS repeat-associated protein
MILPASNVGQQTPTAQAASGATFPTAPNYNFEVGPIQVGSGPSNYDFASGGSSWSKIGSGSVTYPGGIATFSGSAQLTTTNTYALSSEIQSIKLRFKAGGSATVAILLGGSVAGSDNLNCSGCTSGSWYEKYIAVYPSAQGQSVKLRITQTSGSSEIDWIGTQWVSFEQWTGTTVGVSSQPKGDHTQYAEIKGSSLYSSDFLLTDNMIEFDYSFPSAGSNSFTAYLHRASNDALLGSKSLSGSSVDWTRAVWSWGTNYIGTSVYVRLYSPGQPTRLDNISINLLGAISKESQPSTKAGDPFDTSNGQITHSHTDVAIPGKGIPLEFTRSYHSMLAIEGNLGYNWSHTYSISLRIDSDNSVTVFYATGGSAYFKYSGGSYTPPGDVHDALIKNGDNTYTLTSLAAVKYNFTSAGKLTSIVDRNSNSTAVSYNGSGFLSTVTDAGGRTLTFTTDGSGRITGIQDPLSRTIGFEYDANGDLVEVTDVKTGTTTYTYSNHRMTSLTDSNNHLQNTNIYDYASRVVEQTDPAGGKICVYYGTAPSYTSVACPGVTPAPAAGQTVVVNQRGYKTTYDFDTKFRTTSITDHNSGVTSFTYDSANNRTCMTDPLNNKTGFAYDSNGNVLDLIDAANTNSSCTLKVAGVKWTFTYTSRNDVDLATDPLGRVTGYIYDSSGNLTRLVRKDSGGVIKQLSCVELSSAGLPTTVVNSTDLTLPAGVTDPCTGNKTKLEYNTYGNNTGVVDPRFSGQPTPPKTTLSPDLGGRVSTVTNELSHTTTYTYDAFNMGLSAADHLTNTATQTYDAKGNLKTVVDANRKIVGTAETGSQCGTAGTGNNTDEDSDGTKDDGCPSDIYNYDNADRLIEVIDSIGQKTTYSYDAMSNLITVTNTKRQPVGSPESGTQCGTAGTGNNTDDDSDGTKDDGCPSTKHAYDSLDRLTSTTDALGRVTSYQYDAASNLTQRTDGRGLVTKYFPDSLRRLDLIEYWTSGVLTSSVDYAYNAVGFRTQMVDASGTTTYTPDAVNRLSSATFPGPKTVSYTYDDLPGGSAADYPGQRTVMTYPDSKTATYTYLANGAMSTVTDWLSLQTAYTYNDAGMLTKAQLPNGVWTDYGYDNADRLTSAVNKKTGPVTLSSFTYTLDAAGNRTQMVDLGGTNSYQYDQLYRLTQVTYPGPTTDTYTYDAAGNRLTKNATTNTYDAADQMLTVGAVSYGYDNNGNQTTRASDTFTYDHENRLTQTVISGATSSSVYNGDGMRMSHTVSGTPTNYTWDVNAGLPVVLQDGTNTYVYGLDLISATDGAGAQTYFTYDGLGSTTDLTNGSATVTGTYSYDVFGAVRAQTGGGSNYWQFTGEQTDADSGLQYLRARHYDPATGRFLSLDPVESGYPYAYAASNPITHADPSGMCIPDYTLPGGCDYHRRDTSSNESFGLTQLFGGPFLPLMSPICFPRAYISGGKDYDSGPTYEGGLVFTAGAFCTEVTEVTMFAQIIPYPGGPPLYSSPPVTFTTGLEGHYTQVFPVTSFKPGIYQLQVIILCPMCFEPSTASNGIFVVAGPP